MNGKASLLNHGQTIVAADMALGISFDGAALSTWRCMRTRGAQARHVKPVHGFETAEKAKTNLEPGSILISELTDVNDGSRRGDVVI